MRNSRLTYLIILLITYSFKGESTKFEELSIESRLTIDRNRQILESLNELLPDKDEIENKEEKNIQQENSGIYERKSLNTDIKLELVDVIFNSKLLSYKKIFSFINDVQIDSDFKNYISFAKMNIYYEIKKHVTRIKKDFEKFFLKIPESQTLSSQGNNPEKELNTILEPLIKESLNIIKIEQDKVTITGFEGKTEKTYAANIFKDHFFNIIIKELKRLRRTLYKKPQKKDSADY